MNYMQEDDFSRNYGRTGIQTMYKQLKWEQLPNPTGIASPKFSGGIIDSKNIVDVAVVIPIFSYCEEFSFQKVRIIYGKSNNVHARKKNTLKYAEITSKSLKIL